MLKRLKIQFVLVTVTLTGLVLTGVLGASLWTTWSTQHDIVDEALERGLNEDLDMLPTMGGGRGGREGGGPANNMIALYVDVSSDGVIIKSSKAPVVINTSVLEEVVDAALDADDDSGYLSDLHVAWKRCLSVEEMDWYASYLYGEPMTEVAARIVMVDTTAMDSTFENQLKSSVITLFAALVALFGVSWVLATWMVKPVARAWDEQKRFVADASHELKTPLAVIMANTDILRADEDLPDGCRRWVESTASEATHMRSLVGDLLELARADDSASSGVMRKEDVDLSDVVESAALEFDAIAFERMCLIECAVEPGLHVKGDPEWLERLVKILIDNACKYAAEGTTIDVKLARVQGKTRLTVHNLGNPIDPEDLEHLFDRFYRSDKARARETGGFGLGLAIAKGLTEAHGGKISATSTASEGTTFTVVL